MNPNSDLKILILDEAKLDLKAGNKQVYFGYRRNSGMTGITGLIFSVRLG